MNKLDEYINSPFEFQNELNILFAPNDELTILDIGACEGEDSIKFSRLYPNSKILTFEPLPKNILKIKKNFKKYGLKNAKVFPVALSNKKGNAVFHVSSGRPKDGSKDWDYGNKSSSLLPPKETKNIHKWLKFNETIRVKTDRLENILKADNVRQIDFVYMDVQGAEKLVLLGAGKYLSKIKAIWLEVESVELYKSQPLKKDIETFMNQHNFYKIKDTVNEVSGDQLYVNKAMIPIGKILKLVSRERFKVLKTIRTKGVNKLKHTTGRIKKKIIKNQIIHLKDNHKMIVTPDMEWTFADGGYYELNVAFWLNKLMIYLPKPIFYDIGANLGYYSVVSSGFANKVYAFEPTLSTNKILRRNLELNKIRNVEVLKTGVSQKSEIAKLNHYSSIGNNSVYQRTIPKGHPLKHTGSEDVQLISIDEFVQNKGVLPPSIIKIDIEGGELKALQGAKHTLQKHKPIILFEYSETTSKDAGYNREDIIAFLSDYNYLFFGLADDYSERKLVPIINKRISTGVGIDNVIAVPNKEKKLLTVLSEHIN